MNSAFVFFAACADMFLVVQTWKILEFQPVIFKDGKRAYIVENVIKSHQLVINEECCDNDLEEDEIEERERIHETMFA
jgi:hypothetical protein